ncbi:MAG TPA: response regulator transcription factor [Methylomirabilota bacterium]|nr:response regulator transcription factor [Methylomirabilota bacterium]
MKILIAEDDLIARKVLRAFLEKSHYEVEAVENGEAALKALSAPEAPHVAILDWMMPLMTGPQVCAKLRAAVRGIRPYIMLLSAKGDKQDIATGLDAGADDYLTKPFNPLELLARLRVAKRTIDYQLELQKHISELETLAQRYNLLGEIVGQQGECAGAEGFQKAEPAEGAPAEAHAPVELTADEIDAIIVRTLGELGLGEARASRHVPEGPYRASSFTAWAGMILVREQVWIDFLLEADPVAAAVLVERALRRRAASEREVAGVLAETLTLLNSSFRAALVARGGEVLTPIMSRALRTDSLNKPPPVPMDREVHSYTLSDFSLGLTVVRHSCPARLKTPGQLHESDILAAPFRSPEIQEVLLLNQGVILNERFIEKLATLAQTELKGLQLPVFAPSRLASYFYADSRSGAMGDE